MDVNQFMSMQMNLMNMMNPYYTSGNYNMNFNNAALQFSNYCMCDLSS